MSTGSRRLHGWSQRRSSTPCSRERPAGHVDRHTWPFVKKSPSTLSLTRRAPPLHVCVASCGATAQSAHHLLRWDICVYARLLLLHAPASQENDENGICPSMGLRCSWIVAAQCCGPNPQHTAHSTHTTRQTADPPIRIVACRLSCLLARAGRSRARFCAPPYPLRCLYRSTTPLVYA